MKLNSLCALAVSLIGLQSAHAQFIDLDVPKPEATPEHQVYRCTSAAATGKGGVVVSVSEEKLWVLERAADNVGMPFALYDISHGRCPNTYSFKVNLMSEEAVGSLAGCGSGQVQFTLSGQDLEKIEMVCTYQQ